ncbi:Hypothetical predicted protein, partial [Paramuricea clavata]
RLNLTKELFYNTQSVTNLMISLNRKFILRIRVEYELIAHIRRETSSKEGLGFDLKKTSGRTFNHIAHALNTLIPSLRNSRGLRPREFRKPASVASKSFVSR